MTELRPGRRLIGMLGGQLVIGSDGFVRLAGFVKARA